MRWSTTKTNRRRNSQHTKFSVIDLLRIERGNLSDTRPKSPCGKSSSCRFRRENAITKATEYVTFGFSFRIFFERHCLKAIRIFQCFGSHNPKWNPTNHLVLRIVKALLFIHQSDQVARKASDELAADLLQQTYVKKYNIFSHVLVRLFAGLKILV